MKFNMVFYTKFDQKVKKT